MAEEQLIDYIKKARDAGQPDEQSRSLLYKNGWTVAEVDEAVAAIAQPNIVSQAQPKIQPQTQIKPMANLSEEMISQSEPEVQTQPIMQSQPQAVAQPDIQPKMQAMQEPMQIPSDMPTQRGNFGGILKFLIILIILAILGVAGWFIYSQMIVVSPKPQAVINSMVANISNVKSYHSLSQGEIDASSASNQMQGKFVLTNDLDITDLSNPKLSATFSFDLIPQGSATSLASINANIIAVDKVLYFKINGLTVPTNASSLGTSGTALALIEGLNTSQIVGKWFEFDQASAQALSSAKNLPINIGNVDTSNIIKQIQELFLSENLFTAGKQLSNETVSGQNAYHYSAVITTAKLQDFINKLWALGIQQTLSAQAGNMAQAFIQTAAGAIGDTNLDLWIGKTDKMLYELNVDKVIDLSKIIPGTTGQSELKLNTVNSNFNKPILIQAPMGAQKIEDTILPMMKNQKAYSDMNQIWVASTQILAANKSYVAMCKNGFLAGSKITVYGTEFITSVNDIIKSGAKNPLCFANATDYCISSQLADGSWLCIDKNNIVGTTKCVLATTACK